ncbi:MAG: NlpC/P60 family protein, partial [Rhizorhabdus sp.]
KSPVIGTLPFGAKFVGETHDGFIRTNGCFLHSRHVMAIGKCATDAVAVAEMFLGMPYLWGGRGEAGIDCSGLTQVALAATGIATPRDTDMQRESVGELLPEEVPLRRGDIVSFPGHVGLMVNETLLIHANAHWMSVVTEPLAHVVARLAPNHEKPVLNRRRLKS